MEFRLLGPVELRDDKGERVDLGAAEQPMIRCVLAVLLYYLGETVEFARLDRLIWGPRPAGERRGEGTRQKYIATLRRELKAYGVALPRPDGRGYWISVAREQVDRYQFEDLVKLGSAAAANRQFTEAADYLTRALELCRGRALAGLPGAWAESVRMEYDRKRDEAERLRFGAELEIGPSLEQIERFTAWQAVSGPDDESVRLLMMAHCRTGRPDLAEKCFESAKKAMKVLGRVPGESVQQLLRRVRERDPALLGPLVAAGEPSAGLPLAGEPAGRPAPEPVFEQIGVMPAMAGGFQVTSALTEVEDQLRDVPGVSCWILSGLGGVGKTQLAAALAGRLRARGQADVVVWITASSRQEVLGGYARARSGLLSGDPATDEQDATRFLEWLKSTDRSWLVVLDDLDAPATISGLWPPVASAGRVLVTTRRRDASLNGDGRRVIEVKEFSAGEARSYLAAKLTDRPHLARGAEQLAAALGHLPLALSQAVAYLVDRGLTCAEYQRRLAASKLAKVLPEWKALPDSQLMTVAQTWLLSVELANTLEPPGLAGPVLELASQLDPAGIPTQIFTAPAATGYLQWAVDREVSAGDSLDALYCLNRLSLASPDRAEDGYLVQVHALVQRVTRDLLSRDRCAMAHRACADALDSAWPAERGRADVVQAFRANALALFRNDVDDLLADGVHPVLLRLGKSLGESGSFAAAAAHLGEVHVAAAQHLGPGHPDVLRARLDEAYWLGQGRDEKQAVRLLRAVAGDCRRVLGPEHPLTFEARLYSARYRGTEAARKLRSQAAEGAREDLIGELQGAREDLIGLAEEMSRVLGPRHEETMTVRHDAAWSLGELEQYPQALHEFTCLLEDREHALGPDHHHTLITRNNIAHYTNRSGDHAAALRAYGELLPDMIRVLGLVHPHTLATRGNIARLRWKTGDGEVAVRQLRQLVEEMRRELGPDHPFTLETAKFLADPEG